jgi:SOS-response transcriptional repressor LexA
MTAMQARAPVKAAGIDGDYLLRIRADFPEFSLMAGDLITARRRDTAEPGQIVVVAGAGGQATLRRFRDLGEARMLGVVVGMYRSIV